MDEPTYDAVVIGGGAAGLSAALVLGRARRRVAVVDAGAPRNAPAAHMQGFLSRDGMAPADLLASGRAEVAGYGVELIDGPGRRDRTPGFTVRLAGGRALAARRLLIATGVRDELPDIAGVRERWGRDLLHCPYCHGWEVRDQPIGVLGTVPGSVQHALLVAQWSDDVIFFAHTHDAELDGACAARGTRRLDRRRARSRGSWSRTTASAASSSRRHRDRANVRCSSGPRTCRMRDGLLHGLGCEVDDGGLRHRRRHRPHEHRRGLGCRQRGRSPGPGDHGRGRRIRGGDRDQRRPGPGRRRARHGRRWPCCLSTDSVCMPPSRPVGWRDTLTRARESSMPRTPSRASCAGLDAADADAGG